MTYVSIILASVYITLSVLGLVPRALRILTYPVRHLTSPFAGIGGIGKLNDFCHMLQLVRGGAGIRVQVFWLQRPHSSPLHPLPF